MMTVHQDVRLLTWAVMERWRRWAQDQRVQGREQVHRTQFDAAARGRRVTCCCWAVPPYWLLWVSVLTSSSWDDNRYTLLESEKVGKKVSNERKEVK